MLAIADSAIWQLPTASAFSPSSPYIFTIIHLCSVLRTFLEVQYQATYTGTPYVLCLRFYTSNLTPLVNERAEVGATKCLQIKLLGDVAPRNQQEARLKISLHLWTGESN